MNLSIPERLPSAIRVFVDDIHRLIGPVFLVGGLVRNTVLGTSLPNHLHLLVSRSLSDCEQRLRDGGHAAVAMGNKHNSLLIPLKGEERPRVIEISTFRHRPNCPATVEEDLLHRDLTINAIAYCWPYGPLVDPFNGLEDLKNSRTRLVNGLETIQENPLRALRFFRLTLQLSMMPDPADLALCANTRPHPVPGEQLRGELDRIFSLTLRGGDVRPLLQRLFSSSLGLTVFPELKETESERRRRGEDEERPCIRERVIDALLTITQPREEEDVTLLDLRWAAFLFRLNRLELPEEEWQNRLDHQHENIDGVKSVLKRFGFSKRRRRRTMNLLQFVYLDMNPTDRLLNRLLKKQVPLEGLFRLVDATRESAGPEPPENPDTTAGESKTLGRILKRCRHLVDANRGLNPRDLALGGGEILDLVRQPPGPWMGELQKLLVDWVSEQPERNQPAVLREKIQSWLANQ